MEGNDIAREMRETEARDFASAHRSLLENVRVRGAREHNLKNIDLEIPRDVFVVFTGVSGSGKSSLAFGTLFAESQRRYLESVSPYARRLIDQSGIPQVDSITGLPPAVALQQQRGARNTRSTVGSVSTLSNVVRMLYSRAGVYPAKQPMLYAEDFSPNTPQGACPECHGIGRVYDVPENLMVPDPSKTIRERAIASWPTAWGGQNLRDVLIALGYDVDTPWKDLPQKDRYWILYTEDHPTVTVHTGVTPEQAARGEVDDAERTYQGTYTGARRYVLDTFAKTKSALTKKKVAQFLSTAVCPLCHGARLKPEALSVTFAGLSIAEFADLPLSDVDALLREVVAENEAWGEGTDPNRSEGGGADGAVLGAKARAAAVKSRVDAGGSAHASAPDVRRTPNYSVEKRKTASLLATQILNRLEPMIDLGLGYLSLRRSTPTLSGGELQRLRLATQLSSELFGVVYVLDEPSAGLHPQDIDALLKLLRGLKDRGNSLFVVEHSVAAMRAADWMVDLGPHAGERGGHVLYSGPPSGLKTVPNSLTATYLFGTWSPAQRDRRRCTDWLELEGVTRNNIRDLTVAFPLRALTAVTGISGSGKSSLVSQALPVLVGEELGRPVQLVDEGQVGTDMFLAEEPQHVLGEVSGEMPGIKRIVSINQKPIGRTPRSNVATYTGLFDHVRNRFAQTPLAKRRRYKPGRFSFNVAGGRCPVCEGEGFVMVELLFLPSVYSTCPQCHGTRYKEETLQVVWHGKNVAEILALNVDEAHEFFAGHEDIMRSLSALQQVGLGYLRLGQPATELSGGEAQRVKLATELQRAERGDTLYVLDEPTAGLHPADADKLLGHLQNLVDAGNTVIMAELDMRIVAQSDFVIDLGPGAGDRGGRIVAQGTPEEVARAQESATAPFLASALT